MYGLVHIRAVVVFGMLLFAFAQRTAAQRHRDPCRLLTDAEVRTVQGRAPTEKIPSEQPAGSFRFTQCYFRTPELSSSVSVALGLPLTDSKRSGPRDYWRAQFKRDEREDFDEKRKEPRRLAGLGDEAFWVGDPVTGALYVLRGEVFLRVSVGGSPNQAQNIKRARTLATYALKRLDTTGPTARSR
ncbi:MAG TPA: hypothetical protein VFX63_00465 [Pyrinomonadaceae bacterium]|nr:hypothetical protein [Pyrinomonadaceae bacterium]